MSPAMPDFHEFDVAYVAPMRILPPRARKEKDAYLTGRTRIRVPNLSLDEAPLAVRVRHANSHTWYQHRKLGADFLLPVQSLRQPDNGVGRSHQDGVPPEQLAQALLHPKSAAATLFRALSKTTWTDEHIAEMVDDLGDARVVADGRDRVINLVHEAARDLVLLEGALHRKTFEPHCQLSHYASPDRPRSVIRNLNVGAADRSPGPRFRLGREDAMRELTERCAGIGYDIVGTWHDLEYGFLDHGALGLREDLANAEFALGLALRDAGPILEDLPAEAILTLSDIKRLRVGIQSGTGAPEAASVLLGRLADEVPRTPRTLGIHMGIEVGIAAIDLSLPSPELAAMDEHDAEAIQGLGM